MQRFANTNEAFSASCRGGGGHGVRIPPASTCGLLCDVHVNRMHLCSAATLPLLKRCIVSVVSRGHVT